MSDEYDILIELSADDMKKAADEREHRDAEITRLRAENEKFFKQAEMNARLLTENASLRAENEKLREAFMRFYDAALEEVDDNEMSWTIRDWWREELKAAAAALKESGDE